MGWSRVDTCEFYHVFSHFIYSALNCSDLGTLLIIQFIVYIVSDGKQLISDHGIKLQL